MVTYQDFAKDLRTLAAMLDHLAPDLPLPRYAEGGLGIQIHLDTRGDAEQAGRALGIEADHRSNGHTTAKVDIDTVHVEFIHIDEQAMAEHHARTSYSRNVVGTPIGVTS